MYGNPYYGMYSQQMNIDNIDSKIADLQKMKNQIQSTQNANMQPTNLTQNFQLAPTTTGVMKFVNSIDEVIMENVFTDTPFFSKDMSILWIKNTANDIKTYELNEVVQKDEKDMMIDSLQMQIEELRKEMMRNAKCVNDDVIESVESEKSRSIQKGRTSKK